MYTCASNSLPSVFVVQLPSHGLAAAAFPCPPSDQRKTQSLLMHALEHLFIDAPQFLLSVFVFPSVAC